MQPLILSQQLTQGVADFLATTFPSITPGFEGLIERFLSKRDNIFKGPYITLPLPFRKFTAEASPIFPWLPQEFVPHAHQAVAFKRLSGEQAASTLVATGTGSGKTECFLFPILEHCRQARAENKLGIKAIILYPMNALATDQASRVAKEIVNTPALQGIRAGLYVGESPAETSKVVGKLQDGSFSVITDRNELRNNPPDILLTNYKMLDFLLIRAADTPLWQHQQPDTLRYLVVDEIHTFDGAQGTDLACLIRRLKGRLNTPPGQLVCTGTSATLGDGGAHDLLAFASDVFGETLSAQAVVGEDRLTVGEFLEEAIVEYTRFPQPSEYPLLSLDNYVDADSYIAAQFPLWFGESCSIEQVQTDEWRYALGDKLKCHFAFHNLLRDLERQGAKSVLLDDLLALLLRRLPASEQADYPQLWLSSLLSLVSYARVNAHQKFFLQLKVEIWLRELRRMVAPLVGVSADEDSDIQQSALVLRHHDDLTKTDADQVYLPIIHCRECNAAGWGATVQKNNELYLDTNLKSFYTAFFNESTTTRFIFPAQDEVNPALFSRRNVCSKCGGLHSANQRLCGQCENQPLVTVDITNNLAERTRNGAKYTVAHHDCPYCNGVNTLSILGSQAASLAAVLVGQLFASRYNSDKKLIAFSDSVQDAAHRAGFLAARTWRLNFRPALAQIIKESPEGLTLEELSKRFSAVWRKKQGDALFVANFLPSQLQWKKDYEALLREGELPSDSDLADDIEKILPWVIKSEFGQEAHIGRTLVATGTASVAPKNDLLDQAVDWLYPRLNENLTELAETSLDELMFFLRGILRHFQRLGAWRDNELEYYARMGCNHWVYKGNVSSHKFLSAFRRPRYVSLIEYKNCAAVTGSHNKLFRAWAFHALPALANITLGADQLLMPLYRLAFDALTQVGIMSYVEAELTPNCRIWSLEPDAFDVSLDAARWQCSHCHARYMSAVTDDMEAVRCFRPNCNGICTAAPIKNDYYRRLYLNADIKRVVAKEHTGLLPRPTREAVEQSFKSNHDRPGALNLLSATPTLEMGIDIGDLSSVLQCSIPPKQANYIQRAGRAGRKTGNALLMSLAGSKPHDMYFWHDPRSMIAGDVQAPGVFLNASAVLERQLTAFTLDCWVHSQGKVAVIPDEIRSVYSAINNKSLTKFPYSWLAYVDKNRSSMLDAFVALFNKGSVIALLPETVQWLQRFIEGEGVEQPGLSHKVINCLQGLAADVASLKNKRDAIIKEISTLQSQPVLGEEQEQELMRLSQDRAGLSRLIGSMESKATLNVLTDEGLLPNYAFPEQGVLLRSLIVKESKTAGKGEYETETYEYERPGATAITELAPNNTFYAEGRKVVINQVDISKVKPEFWRFCRLCSYSEPVAAAKDHANCPRCGDSLWKDSGRVREMLRLTTVFARTLDSKSRIADDSDERQRGFYVRQALVDSAQDAVSQAFSFDESSFPFGFEFLNRVTFREVNFGDQSDLGTPMAIGGKEMVRPGFTICAECGTIQRRRKAEELYLNHATWCKKRKADDAAIQQCVFLYREFASEGVRIFLPEVGFADSNQAMQSFIAAIELGLSKRFRGAVDHLRITPDMRMAAGSDTPRCYLVIYDSVPGGTGYLKDLMRAPEPLLEVFEASLNALNSCECNQDEIADGCYKCVYRYRNSNDRKQISRSTAQKLLLQVLEHKASLKEVSQLVEMHSNNYLFDSVLEKNFIEALRRDGHGGKFQISNMLVNGKPGYLLTAGKRRWRIELQVSLNHQQGIVLPCKPDFVFWPDDAVDDLPIAVFVDGWTYHKDIISVDLAKRMAIAKSGRFNVWSLTWDDVQAVLDEKSVMSSSLLSNLLENQQLKALYRKFLSINGIASLESFYTRSAFDQLRERLFAISAEQLKQYSAVIASSVLAVPDHGASPEEFKLSAFWLRLEECGLLPSFENSKNSYERVKVLAEGMLLYLYMDLIQAKAILQGDASYNNLPWLALDCDFEQFSESEKKLRWQQILQLLNVLLPLQKLWVGNASMSGLNELADVAVSHADPDSTEWLSVIENTMPPLIEWCSELSRTGVDVPVVGYELLDKKGCVLAEAELAWPSQKIAVFLPECDETLHEFEKEGWQCFHAIDTVIPESLTMLLAETLV